MPTVFLPNEHITKKKKHMFTYNKTILLYSNPIFLKTNAFSSALSLIKDFPPTHKRYTHIYHIGLHYTVLPKFVYYSPRNSYALGKLLSYNH